MGRKEDLESHIRESYGLIREYETIVQTSSDPREKARAWRIIEEQRKLVRDWLGEYVSLCRHLGLAVPNDIREIAAWFGETGRTDREAARPDEASLHPDTTDIPEPKLRLKPQQPVPRLAYLIAVLLVLDLVLTLILGWRFLGHRQALLSYLEVVAGVLGLGLEILLLAIVIQRRMSVTEVLHWFGTNRPLQLGIITLTGVLLITTFWPSFSTPRVEQLPTPRVTQSPLSPTPSLIPHIPQPLDVVVFERAITTSSVVVSELRRYSRSVTIAFSSVKHL